MSLIKGGKEGEGGGVGACGHGTTMAYCTAYTWTKGCFGTVRASSMPRSSHDVSP
jgi:hypothetical protein